MRYDYVRSDGKTITMDTRDTTPMEIDHTSHSYLLGQAEYKLKVCQDENARLRAALDAIRRESELDSETYYLAEQALRRW